MQFKEINFEVEKVPLDYQGTTTGFYATRRTDNGVFLSTIGKGYQVYQPQQMIDAVDKICKEKGYEVYKEFCINGGKRIMISVKTGETMIGDNKLIKQITVTNSYTGESSLGFSFGNLNLACANQFYKIARQASNRFLHVGDMNIRVEDMLKNIEILKQEEKVYYNSLQNFVSTSISKDLAAKMIKTVLDVPEIITDEFPLSTRKSNQLDNFMNSWDIECDRLGENLWSLINSATHYTTHVLKQTTHGTGQKIANQIYDNCLQLI